MSLGYFPVYFRTVGSNGQIPLGNALEFRGIVRKGAEECISITDKSQWRPVEDMLQNRIIPISADEAALNYDFVDGKDNGMKVPVSRIKGHDIAELSEAIREEQEEVKGKIAKRREEEEQAAKEQAFSDKVSKIMNSSQAASSGNSAQS